MLIICVAACCAVKVKVLAVAPKLSLSMADVDQSELAAFFGDSFVRRIAIPIAF